MGAVTSAREGTVPLRDVDHATTPLAPSIAVYTMLGQWKAAAVSDDGKTILVATITVYTLPCSNPMSRMCPPKPVLPKVWSARGLEGRLGIKRRVS